MYAIHIVTAVKIFYKQHMTFFVALIVVLTTQVQIQFFVRALSLFFFPLILGNGVLRVNFYLINLGVGVRMGRNIPAVSSGARGDVVAIQSCPSISVQVRESLSTNHNNNNNNNNNNNRKE